LGFPGGFGKKGPGALLGQGFPGGGGREKKKGIFLGATGIGREGGGGGGFGRVRLKSLGGGEKWRPFLPGGGEKKKKPKG